MNLAFLLLISAAPAAWEEVHVSTHFEVRATKQDAFLLPDFAEALEKSLDWLTEWLGPLSMQEKIVLEIYPDRKKFQEASGLTDRQMETSGAIGIHRFGKLMLVSPRELPMGYRWQDAASHELCHLWINRTAGETPPIWIHEGVSRFLEQGWRTGSPTPLDSSMKNRLKEGLENGKFLGFPEMDPGLPDLPDPESVSLAYAQAASAIHFQAEKEGKSGVGRLVREHGKTDPEKFAAAWKEWLARQNLETRPGAMESRPALDRRKEELEFVGISARQYLRLGDKFRAGGRRAAALDSYEKARALEPYNPVILTKIARLHMEQQRWKEAEELLALSTQTSPSYAPAFYHLGRLYYNLNRPQEAIQWLQEAYAIHPFDPRPHVLLIQAGQRLNRTDLVEKHGRAYSALLR